MNKFKLPLVTIFETLLFILAVLVAVYLTAAGSWWALLLLPLNVALLTRILSHAAELDRKQKSN